MIIIRNIFYVEFKKLKLYIKMDQLCLTRKKQTDNFLLSFRMILNGQRSYIEFAKNINNCTLIYAITIHSIFSLHAR